MYPIGGDIYKIRNRFLLSQIQFRLLYTNRKNSERIALSRPFATFVGTFLKDFGFFGMLCSFAGEFFLANCFRRGDEYI